MNALKNIDILKVQGNIEHYGMQALSGEYLQGCVNLRKEEVHPDSCGEENDNTLSEEEKSNTLFQEGILYVEVQAECTPIPWDYCRCFQRDHALNITLQVPRVQEYMATYCFDPFWTRPVWGKDFRELTKEARFLLLHAGEQYIFVLPLVGEDFQTVICGGEELQLCVNMFWQGSTKIAGTIALISVGNNPYEAVHKGFAAACEKLMITPLREKKTYPEVLNKLGWCSWNAFKHDLSEEKFITKLEEFKAKNIPVKWVLIDDGWSETKDWKLQSIYEDREKFPDGLKSMIQRMKKEYGIEAVGIWHSLTGYWYGVDFEDENSLISWQGRRIPSGYGFYAKWHDYLKEQGIDFLKVDTQGNAVEFLRNGKGSVGAVVQIQEGLERSAAEHFDFMINCMGMDSVNAFGHRSSVLMRSSADFVPEKADAFYNHAVDNIYNAVFMSEMFYCDYDMFWSGHFAAKQNAVLRFMSGGPVYLSDAQDGSEDTYLKMFCKEDGSFLRPDVALRPTYDCLFGFDKVLKAFTKRGEEVVVTAFTFEEGGIVTLSAEDFGGTGDYEVQEFFSGMRRTLTQGEKLQERMDAWDVKLYFVKALK